MAARRPGQAARSHDRTAQEETQRAAIPHLDVDPELAQVTEPTPEVHDVDFVLTARQLRDRSRTLRDRLATEVATFHRARELLKATRPRSFSLVPSRGAGN